MIPLIRAQEIAARVVEQLRPFCKRIEIAGSIRRQRPEVGDIDLVIEAADRLGLEKRVESPLDHTLRGAPVRPVQIAAPPALALPFHVA